MRVGDVAGTVALSPGSPGEIVLQVCGDANGGLLPVLEQTLPALEDGGCRCLTLDMSAVTFLDSEGLRALAAAARELEWRDCELRLRRPSVQVQRVLELSGMDRVLHMESAAELPG